MLPKNPMSYQWALPESIDVPPDELQVRLDFYHDSIILYLLDKGVITTRVVSARDIALALLREIPLRSDLLPQDALWWGQGKQGVELALWRPPKVWLLALQLEPFKPPRRMKLPMPGLIFVCSSAKPPRVYAAKRRPEKPSDNIYHAPLFNVFRNGSTCPGTHKYPDNVKEIPESFMVSFFTATADYRRRSNKHPDDLLKLWDELEGKERYPLNDLVQIGELKDIMK
jgi:hypothetical protein